MRYLSLGPVCSLLLIAQHHLSSCPLGPSKAGSKSPKRVASRIWDLRKRVAPRIAWANQAQTGLGNFTYSMAWHCRTLILYGYQKKTSIEMILLVTISNFKKKTFFQKSVKSIFRDGKTLWESAATFFLAQVCFKREAIKKCGIYTCRFHISAWFSATRLKGQCFYL